MADKIKKAKASRDVYFNRLNETQKLGKNAQRDETFHTAFKMRYLGLEATYKSFEKYHFLVVELASNAEGADLDAEDAIRIHADDLFYSSLADYNDLFKQDAVQSRTQPPNVKLPKITLPIFNGQLKSWPTFYDLFSNLIDKNLSLTNVERFQYLLSSLSEEVLPIVSGLPITENNYSIALDALVKRFQNKRILATHYWKAICDLEPLNNNSAHDLRALLDTFCENLDALNNLNFPTDEWDFIMLNMLLQKLDQDTIKRFELEYSCLEMPTFKLLRDFLSKQCIALDSFALSISSNQIHNRNLVPKGPKNLTALVANPSKCSFCRQSHFISSCKEFSKKTPHEKYSFSKENKLCINCLKSSHQTLQCDSTYACRKCNLKHHTLLHFSRNNPANPQSNLNALGAFANLNQSPTTVLLSTIQIDVLDCRGNVLTCRALLDSASQTNFITEKCFRRLGLFKINSNLSVQGLGQFSSKVSGLVGCTIFPKNQLNPMFKTDALIIPKICSPMPTFKFETNSWSYITNIKLADEHFNIPGEIDILLGAEIFSTCLQGGRIVGSVNQPIALETHFGWVLMGKVSSPSTSLISLCATLENSLDNIIKRFWEIEEPPSMANMSDDDLICESHFAKTHFRTESGRYCVSLPFKDKPQTFLDTKSLALRRFYNLEHRLIQTPELYRSYCEFMKDYLDSGHMSAVVGSSCNSGKTYFIPHHAVLRPDSSTTKLRVVFDASAKVTNDLSLNESLLTGPKLQKNIITILLNFRLHKYVLTADIKQMYRQILIRPEYRSYQKILWRFCATDPIQEYYLNTVTYGVSSAPFLALRTIQQLVTDEGSLYPLATKVLNSEIFVDDILASCASIDEARTIRCELIGLLSRGGFELRKWASNEPSLLSDMPDSARISQSVSLDMEPDSFIKILGLQWHPLLDSFSFKVVPREEECTKRGILSELARVYDPLGYLSPISFFTKHLISQLWALGIDWDARPPSSICNKWDVYKSQLSLLSTLSIPRQIIDRSCTSFQLHGFSDGSEKGYAAVIYIRTVNSNNSVSVNMVMAKSKVAPLKRITLPRLELCGAVLLSDLISYVRNVYQNINFEVFAWSDSMVALAWLKSSPHRWKCFVGNRVTRIQESTSPAMWHHVPSEDNAADCASRGLMPAELVNHSLWWAGPKWLSYSPEKWPKDSKAQVSPLHVTEEERTIALTVTTKVTFPSVLIEKYSSLSKIKRIVAYFLYFINNTQTSKPKLLGPLVDHALYQALVFLVKNIQAEVFSVDISNLRKHTPVSKPLRRLAPFLDKGGVLRVGGRLSNSSLDYDKKFPILLPRSHRITELIIEDFHKTHLHPGAQALEFLINQQFWILSAKRAIRSVILKCVTCFKVNPKSIEPLMGNLPSPRVNQIKPFSSTGVDMAGPFSITLSRRRGSKSQKAYLCLFICFATKAIHLEVTSDLSTESFLAALQRFIARRGRCNTLFSDQGTNFIGANRELLKHMQSAAEHEKIHWSFNPPSAPHFGGLWEAGVKSVKTHFFRVVGNQILTYEELYTVFVKIEAILNSRPICSISSDPSDLSALTPGHFLVLEPLTTVPCADLTDVQLNRLNRWQLIQRMTQDFWRRWHQEYLHSLQQRSKWNKSTTSIDMNMLVLIKTDNLPPLQWRLGRIVELHKGKDGICRVCTVKTAQGTFQRPVVKLCPLPIN